MFFGSGESWDWSVIIRDVCLGIYLCGLILFSLLKLVCIFLIVSYFSIFISTALLVTYLTNLVSCLTNLVSCFTNLDFTIFFLSNLPFTESIDMLVVVPSSLLCSVSGLLLCSSCAFFKSLNETSWSICWVEVAE